MYQQRQMCSNVNCPTASPLVQDGKDDLLSRDVYVCRTGGTCFCTFQSPSGLQLLPQGPSSPTLDQTTVRIPILAGITPAVAQAHTATRQSKGKQPL
jgi:hypothetical protein